MLHDGLWTKTSKNQIHIFDIKQFWDDPLTPNPSPKSNAFRDKERCDRCIFPLGSPGGARSSVVDKC
jgi:hypothetical protein